MAPRDFGGRQGNGVLALVSPWLVSGMREQFTLRKNPLFRKTWKARSPARAQQILRKLTPRCNANWADYRQWRGPDGPYLFTFGRSWNQRGTRRGRQSGLLFQRQCNQAGAKERRKKDVVCILICGVRFGWAGPIAHQKEAEEVFFSRQLAGYSNALPEGLCRRRVPDKTKAHDDDSYNRTSWT